MHYGMLYMHRCETVWWRGDSHEHTLLSTRLFTPMHVKVSLGGMLKKGDMLATLKPNFCGKLLRGVFISLK
jgi:hypothetical protein